MKPSNRIETFSDRNRNTKHSNTTEHTKKECSDCEERYAKKQHITMT